MADAFLEYNDVSMENMGHLNAGRIKLSDRSVVFKSAKTGKVETIQTSNLDSCAAIRLANKPALKLMLNDGKSYRFAGFPTEGFEKIQEFAKRNWNKELEQMDPSVKGWNYGQANFVGSMLEFEVDSKPSFDIPLQNVSNCSSNRNEAVLEFHMNDECPVALMEMRFHIPQESAQDDMEDPVEEFRKNVMKYAGVVLETDKPLALLEQILCTTPRGRYDIKMFPSHLSLHGKTFDYKIPIKTIMRLFLLPHKDGRHMFFVIGLDPPIRQGQTRYHYLVLEFTKDEEIELELGLSDEQLEDQYSGKLEKEMKGPVYAVVSRIMRALVNQRIIVPGSFVGHSGTPAIGCAYKSAAGFLYPLEKGFVCVHKPPMYIRFEEVSCVNFDRSDVSTRSFDFEIELKTGLTNTFTSVEKEEYTRLYDFVTKKKLRIRNSKRLDKPTYKEAKADPFAGSDSDDSEPDHYKAKLQSEAKARQDQEEEDSEDEDSDYDEKKDKQKQQKKEKSDSSSASGSEPDEEYDSGGGKSDSDSDKKSEPSPNKNKKKPSKAKAHTPEKKPRKPRKASKRAKKDPNAPKKAQSAYMIWFQANRKDLAKPGEAVTEVAKRAGATWKGMTDDDKQEWMGRAKKDKERYEKEMKVWKAGGAGASSSAPRASSGGSPTKAKSKEYVASDDSSSEDNKPLAKKGKNKSSGEESAESRPQSDSD